jgi:hypothetical protein
VLWNIVGYPPSKTTELLLPADALFDAALAGVDAGEQVTSPGTYEPGSWRGPHGARAVFSYPGRTTPSAHRQSAA